MKIEKDYDCAIVVVNEGIGVYFSRTPDLDIASTILGLAQNDGIDLPDDSQAPGGIIAVEFGSCLKKPETQRLFYWADVSPVYEVRKVAMQVAQALRDEHGMRVRVIEDFGDDNPYDRSTILCPV